MDQSPFEEFSGSGNGTLTVTFDCSTSELSLFNVTDREFWSFRDSVKGGGIPIAVFESIILCVALTWNLFIIATFIIKFRLLKEPANVLLLSLAINDTLFCVLVVPFSLVAAARGEFIIGSNDRVRCQACSTQGFFFVVLTIAQVHLIALLSIDRWILLYNPLKYRTMKNVRVTLAGIIAVCVICFVLSIPPAFGFGQWEFNRNFGLCMPRWTPLLNTLFTGIIIMETLIPIFIIAITNVWTYKIVRHFLSKNVERKKSFRNTAEEIDSEESIHKKQQHQLVKLFGALLVANFITWFPIFIMFFVVLFTSGNNVPEYLYIIGWLCYLLSPTIHPILESFFIKELRSRVNKAKKTVRTQVHKASKSIIRMATLDAFKHIPDDVDDNHNETNATRSIKCAKTTENSKGSPFPLSKGKGLTAPKFYPLDSDTNLQPANLSTSLELLTETEHQNEKLSKRNQHISIVVPDHEVYHAGENVEQIKPCSKSISFDSPQQVVITLTDNTVVHTSTNDTDYTVEIGQVVNRVI